MFIVGHHQFVSMAHGVTLVDASSSPSISIGYCGNDQSGPTIASWRNGCTPSANTAGEVT
eukprot:SAG31_NODE_35204_length_325_cov_0.907080_1_plen_59_part_10